MTMNVYQITIPIYAESQEEAERARQALFAFVDGYRQRRIAVTGAKVVTALERLGSNQFIRIQIDNFLTK